MALAFFLVVTIIAVTGIAPALTSSCEAYNKIIHVSYVSGDDTHDCLSGNQEPCKTLSYVLQQEPDLSCVKVSVHDSTNVTEGIYLSGISNFSVVGEGALKPVINCPNNGNGVSFINSGDIVIEGLAWIDCSVLHREVNNGTNSALIFSRTRNVNVSNCSFTSQWGAGISMYDVGGSVFVTKTLFVNSTSDCSGPDECTPKGAGLHIELGVSESNSGNSYTITECHFFNNTAPSDCYDYLHTGNTLYISLRGKSIDNVFHIGRNRFEFNSYPCQISTNLHSSEPHATAVISVASTTENNAITIEDNTFYQNTGSLLTTTAKAEYSDFEAGALALYLDCQGSNCSGNTVTVHSCNFTENSATSGAVLVRITVQKLSSDTKFSVYMGVLNFTNCTWHSNSANSSGAAVSLFAMEGVTIYTGISFENCSFVDNYIIYNPNHTIVQQDLTAIQHYGAIVSEAIPILFSGSTMFYNNSITALYLNLATVKLTGQISFINNRGVYGGAVFLGQLAWIIPLDNLYLMFENNRARYGGSIYTTFQCYNASSVAYCTTFGDEVGARVCPNQSFPENSSIWFLFNSASISGDAIYLDSRTCSLDCLHGESVVYDPDDNSEVAAPATHMQFNEPAEQNQLNVRLGQNIFLNITTYNEYPSVEYYFSNVSVLVPAVAVTTVYLNCFPDSVESAYNLTGPSALFLENQPFFSNVRIQGPQINTSNSPDCSLQFVTSGSQPALEQTLRLIFFSCRLGYVYSDAKQMCVCFDSGNIICNEDIQNTLDPDACIRYGFWYGNISEDVFTVSPCPSQYCNYDYGNCPAGPCNILESVLPGFCKLPLDEDQQCSGNRGGILCTNCISDHAFTFGAVKCVDKKTCTAGYAVVSLLLIVVFLAVMILVLLLILKLNLHVGSGYLYAFVYYFSVLRYITPAYLPSKFLDILVTIFVSITKVSPSEFIGQVPICFVESMTVIGHHFFQYLHPVLIALTIFLLAALARFCPRIPNPARNSGVHAICILILLSFSSFVEISITLLGPVKFSGSGDIFVNLQPNTRYFDANEHAPYAVVAILILTVLIIPFIILLFTAPFLMSHGYNLTRIKPILDEYQACYRNKWRWIAGYYFLCRLIVFLTSIFDLGVYGNVYVLQIFFLVIFGLHAVIQPYAASWLNIVDAVLLLDLALISLLYGSTADQVFSGGAKVWRDILLHFLLLVPFFYFLGIATHILVPEKLKAYLRRRWHMDTKTGNKKVNTQSATMSSATGNSANLEHSSPGRIYDPSHDREPLLALLSDNGAPSAARYQAVHRSDSDYDYTVQSIGLPPVSEQRNSQLWQDEDKESSERSDL